MGMSRLFIVMLSLFANLLIGDFKVGLAARAAIFDCCTYGKRSLLRVRHGLVNRS